MRWWQTLLNMQSTTRSIVESRRIGIGIALCLLNENAIGSNMSRIVYDPMSLLVFVFIMTTPDRLWQHSALQHEVHTVTFGISTAAPTFCIFFRHLHAGCAVNADSDFRASSRIFSALVSLRRSCLQASINDWHQCT